MQYSMTVNIPCKARNAYRGENSISPKETVANQGWIFCVILRLWHDLTTPAASQGKMGGADVRATFGGRRRARRENTEEDSKILSAEQPTQDEVEAPILKRYFTVSGLLCCLVVNV